MFSQQRLGRLAKWRYAYLMNAVSFLPILAAGIVSAVIGYIWFHPKVFGGVWMRVSGITSEMMQRARPRMPLYAFVALLVSMLVAYVMNYFALAWQVTDWAGALQLGFWCWIGFTAPPMLGMVLWEQKPLRAYLIVAFYWLVAMLAMSSILLLGANMLSAESAAQSTGTPAAYSE